MSNSDANQVFAQVVDLGSFARAAERLGISEIEARGYVQLMEARMGVRLIYEGGQGMHLTGRGTVCYLGSDKHVPNHRAA